MLEMPEDDFIPFAYYDQGMSAVDYILFAAQRNYDFQQIFITSVETSRHNVIMKGYTPSWNFKSTVHMVTAEYAHRHQHINDEGLFFVQSDEGNFYSIQTHIEDGNTVNLHDGDVVQMAHIPLPTDIKKIALVAASLHLRELFQLV